jgi:DNA repair protein RadC
MSQAGALLGIQLLDHLVVARRAYFSFAEAGLLHP